MCIQRPKTGFVESPLSSWPEAWRAASDTSCEHGVLIPWGRTSAEVCDDCNENLGAEQAEGSVGK